MKTNDIRNKFTNFFANRAHKVVPSASLVPRNDPTLLFTNAGMVPFKDVFLGDLKLNYNRAISIQRCVRAGGKHNDLELVGYTARHHTFFEMMGNFSFGDYFKKEAIAWSWEFLTKELQLPQDKLWISVYEEDDEAEKIWINHIGIDPKRISRCGKADNFWSMGETGPCGPCTEIFYDHGSEIAGGPPGSEDADGDRYIEIWNMVFMQYNRAIDGSMTPLPKQSVDTGMGLERIAAVLQGKHNNYDIDIFQVIISACAKLLKCNDLQHHALRVIADHLRASCFLIMDGVLPDNEGRGYVLRRIIRRALRHGFQLCNRVDFMHQLVPVLIDEMSDAYPELMDFQVDLIAVLRREEQQFGATLANGMQLLNTALTHAKESRVLPGDIAFQLYDTYGFPVDLTEDIAREHDITVDRDAFDCALASQRQRSKQSNAFFVDYNASLGDLGVSAFVGYDKSEIQTQVAILANAEKRVDQLKKGEQGLVVLPETSFYPEGGGQVGDQGQLHWPGGQFNVLDVKRQGDAIVHFGEVISGDLKLGQSLVAQVDESRQAIKCHHTATHLLHAALRQVLGDSVNQKGSLVTADRLRFDFTCHDALTQEHIEQVETLVNQVIRRNTKVQTEVMPIEQAKSKGAMALFGEKYSDEVRVLTIGDFSIELCGGTHVDRTGELGSIKIISEEGVAQGVRRIEALAGEPARQWLNHRLAVLDNLAAMLKVSHLDLVGRVEQLHQSYGNVTKALKVYEMRSLQDNVAALLPKAPAVAGVTVLVELLASANASALREGVDYLKSAAKGDIVAVLMSQDEESISLVIGVNKVLSSRLSAGELMRKITDQFGGKGGGRPDLAQGGGIKIDSNELNAFKQTLEAIISTMLRVDT